MADPKASDVRVIIDTDLEDGDLNKMVAIAKVFYDSTFGTDSGLSGDLRFEILRQLAAHFVWVRDAETRVKSVSLAGAIREDYVQPKDVSLEASPFWQTALILDPTGLLTNINAPTAEFEIFGPTRVEGDNYSGEDDEAL